MFVRRSLIASISIAMLLLSPGSAFAGGGGGGDTTPPFFSVAAPTPDATYLLNSTVLAAYGCFDPESGIAQCSGPVIPGAAIATNSVGDHTFTINATNGVGLTAQANITYHVVDAKPDVRIRRIGRTNLVGNDIYSPSAAGEELGASLKAPGIRRFVITIQNDGTQADSYTVGFSGNAVLGIDVTFHHGHPGTDITMPMGQGIYQTPTIQPGGVFRIRAYVSIGTGPTEPGTTRLITARSNNFSSVSDAARFTVGEALPTCVGVC